MRTVVNYTRNCVVLDKLGELQVKLSSYLFDRLRAVLLCLRDSLGGCYLRKLNPQLVEYCSRWGTWRATPCKGLDFPSMTPEARLLASPGRSSAAVAYVPNYRQDPVARSVDNAMQDIKPRLRNILWWRYVQNAGPVRIGEFLNCNQDMAKWELDKAHAALAKVMKVRLYA